MNMLTKEQILEGNKLIALFEAWKQSKVFPKGFEVPWFYSSNEKGHFMSEELLFHSSWNWLMPVVEKIESIHDDHHGYFGVHITSNTCTIQGTNLWKVLQGIVKEGVYMSDTNAVLSTKLESTWYNVVEFIKWYNHNLKQTT